MITKLRTWMAMLFAACIITACYPYPYYGYSSNYDRAWNAALGGAQDAGVSITQAEPENGYIRGTSNGVDVTVRVNRQADGSVRVQFDSQTRDPGLANRFSQAYDRRMGR